mgnify:CR=1 FL=1
MNLNRKILHGDVLDKLSEIPNESIDCIITSPPYWGLRDYGVSGQMGAELNFNEYLDKLSKIMNELKRVLKKTGSCWVNLGDSYGTHRSNEDDKMSAEKQEQMTMSGFEKSRIGIPERFYINCIDSGWIARNNIVWYKSNSMPSSVKDRFTNKFEMIYFLVKSKKYYFNLDTVREKLIDEKGPPKPKPQVKLGSLFDDGIELESDRKMIKVPGQTPHGIHKNRDKGLPDYEQKKSNHQPNSKIRVEYGENINKHWHESIKKQNQTLGIDGNPIPTYSGFNERWQERKWTPDMGTIAAKHSGSFDANGNNLNNPNGKNPGDVFFINPRPFTESHFATFPPELPEKILKCACPIDTCEKCGKPRELIYESQSNNDYSKDSNYARQIGLEHKLEKFNRNSKQMNPVDYLLREYSKCDCNARFQPGIVLDPFFGAGTVGMVAEQLNRRWVGIELNQKYINIAQKRIGPYLNNKLDDF